MPLLQRYSENSLKRLFQTMKRLAKKSKKVPDKVNPSSYIPPSSNDTGNIGSMTLSKSGEVNKLSGDVTLTAGTNVSLTQDNSAKDIKIDVTALSHPTLTGLDAEDRKTGGHTYVCQRHEAASAPTSSDAAPNYDEGDIWVDTAANTTYICVDSTAGAAIWMSAENFWRSTDSVLSPKATNIRIENTTSNSSAGQYVYNGTSDGATALNGLATGASGAVIGLLGQVQNSAHNEAYGVCADPAICIKKHADFIDVTSVANAPTGKHRLYAKSTGLYYKDSAGVEKGPLGSWKRTGAVLEPVIPNDQLAVSTNTSGKNAIEGTLTGTSLGQNNTYGGKFTRTAIGKYADLDISTNTPLVANPGSGLIRIIAGNDRVYGFTSDGKQHDLTKQQSWTFPGSQLAEKQDETWVSSAYGGGAEASVTSSRVFGFDATNFGATETYGKWTWTASYVESLIQAQVATGTPSFKFGDASGNAVVVLKARLKVNATAAFDSVFLGINDVNASDAVVHKTRNNFISAMSDNTWYDAVFSVNAINPWNNNLRIWVWATGKAYTSEQPETKTELYIEQIIIEQWVK